VCPGCDGPANIATSSATLRDSAGIVIVENGNPLTADSTQWTIDGTPAVSIGESDGEEPYLLSKVLGFRQFPDRAIAILDGMTRQVRFYDSTGRFVRRAGRAGGGPAEFGYLHRGLRTGDSLLLVVAGGGAHTVDRQGTISNLQTVAAPAGSTRRLEIPNLVFADGSYLVPDPARRCGVQVDGTCETTARFRRIALDGSIAADYGELPDRRRFQHRRGGGRGLFIFDDFLSPPYWAVRGTRFYFADSRSFEVRIFSGDGRLERIVRAEIAQGKPEDLPERRLRPHLGTDPIPDHIRYQLRGREEDFAAAWRAADRQPLLRAHDGILVDAVGNIWIREYLMGRPTPAAGARWWVFDSTGVLRHAVRMPPVEIRLTDDKPEPVEIGDRYVLGLETDKEGVERVRSYRIRKPQTTYLVPKP
jgi:hypothetical protein